MWLTVDTLHLAILIPKEALAQWSHDDLQVRIVHAGMGYMHAP